MSAFDAREFIDDFEEGLIDETGNTISEASSGLRQPKEEKFKPVGSMAQQEKVLRVNNYYSGIKKKKGGIK